MNITPNVSRILPATALALGAGLVIGWFDVSATEVQGSVLLLMVAAFAIALLSRAPGWLVALATTAGLTLVHGLLRSGNANWRTLIAFVPTSIAAYGGTLLSAVLRSSSTSLTVQTADDTTPAEVAWHERAASAPALLGVALFGCAIVGAVPVYATSVARGQPFAWWLTTIWQIITFIAWAVACSSVLRVWRFARGIDAHGIAPREIGTHAAVAASIAALHAMVLPLLTRLLFIPLGPAGISGAMRWAFAVYLPLDALTYCLIVGLGHASDVQRRARAAATRESAVRGELAASRLASLRAQLRPHFLFNALNAAIMLVRRGDATGSERVLTELSDLLRYVLRGAEDDAGSVENGEFVRLADEASFVESYLAIERQRFPDRLTAAIDVADNVRDAFVPHLVLQPLVENAVRHGVGARLGAGTVTIRAWRERDVLMMTVEDDGPGPLAAAAQPMHGIGLSNSQARLATLYGGAATLTLAARPTGGTEARVVLPFRA